MNKTAIVNAFDSQLFVVIERNTLVILGTSGNRAYASAIGASRAGENGYRVIDLSDAAGFETASANALDYAGAYVAAYARGSDIESIARRYRKSTDTSSLCAAQRVVSSTIRKALGNLSRVKARRWCAEQILAGAVG